MGSGLDGTEVISILNAAKYDILQLQTPATTFAYLCRCCNNRRRQDVDVALTFTDTKGNKGNRLLLC